MKPERIVLTLAGLIGIIAFFLPFIQLQPDGLGENLINFPVSGLMLTQTALDAADVIEYPEGNKLFTVIQELFQNSEKMENKALWGGVMLVLTGPFLFLLFSLGHFVRGLAGKQYKRGIFFALLFSGFAWLVFFMLSGKANVQVLGQEVGLQFNFFKMAGIGFWMAAGSILAAAFSLFFSKNLD